MKRTVLPSAERSSARREVEPRQVALFGLVEPPEADLAAERGPLDEHAAVGARCRAGRAGPWRGARCADRPSRLTACSAESAPTRVPVNQTSSPLGDQPRPSMLAQPSESVRLCPLPVHHRHRSAVVAPDRVLEERDLAAVGRDARAWVSPSRRFAQHGADGELDLCVCSGAPTHDQELGAVRRPIGGDHPRQHLPGRSPRERERGRASLLQVGHLALARHSHQPAARARRAAATRGSRSARRRGPAARLPRRR